jgi:PTH1 family peptidyl-tRNA hydrolase
LRAVVGLGNPESLYEFTRHNVGFDLLNTFAFQNNLIFKPSRQNYYYVKSRSGASSFLLIKPTTYMNLSGIAVSEVIKKYKITFEDLLVVQDDVDLELSELKIKQSGSGGGHNGIASIIYYLNTDRFPRLKIGIGKEFKKGNMVEYVLDKFFPEEMKLLQSAFIYGCELIQQFINGGIKSMLNYFSNPSAIRNYKL